jgi:uncharacterized protein (DUF983 family)
MKDIDEIKDHGAGSDRAMMSGDPAPAPIDAGTAGGSASGPTQQPDEQPTRLVKTALWRGWRRKCPNCGSGPLLKGYLKVRDHCPVCREEFHHHRADDGPAYLTILIVGHLLAPTMLFVFTNFQPDPLIMFTSFSIGTVTLSLYLLPRLKGALVGFQWARFMHGFGRKVRSDP